MEVITVYKVDFDNLENRDAIMREKLGVFVAKGDLTAHGVASGFINSLEPHRHYLGWDGEVYPKYVLEKDNTKGT